MAIRYEANRSPSVPSAVSPRPGQDRVAYAMPDCRVSGPERSGNTVSTQESKLETLTVERRPAEFVYRDQEDYVFMDTQTFEQIALPERIVD